MRHDKGGFTFSTSLRKIASRSDHPFVSDAETLVASLADLYRSLPANYGWRADDVAGLEMRLSGLTSHEHVNAVYWQDVARSIEAYGVLVVFRASDLARGAIDFLNKKAVLAAAPVVRSLLELAVTAIWNANNLEKWVGQIVAAADGAPHAVVVSEDCERLMLKMIHGTRMNEPPSELQQTNVLTYIQKLSRNPNATELPAIYEHLCDVTHPNVEGFARYWSSSVAHDGLVIITKNDDTPAAQRVVESSLWALGWSSACVANAFRFTRKACATLLARWPMETASPN